MPELEVASAPPRGIEDISRSMGRAITWVVDSRDWERSAGMLFKGFRAATVEGGEGDWVVLGVVAPGGT